MKITFANHRTAFGGALSFGEGVAASIKGRSPGHTGGLARLLGELHELALQDREVG